MIVILKYIIDKLPNSFSSLKELFAMSRNAYLNSSLYLSDIMQLVFDNKMNLCKLFKNIGILININIHIYISEIK